MRSPRVLVVTPQPFYQDRGSPIALRLAVEALAALGFSGEVVCFPLGRCPGIPGVRLLRTGNPLGFRAIPIGLSAKKLFLDVLLVGRVAQRLWSCEYVCIHALEEAGFAARVLGPLRGVPVVYDMHSSLPDELARIRPLRTRPARALLRALERWLLRGVDAVVCSAGLAPHVRALAPRTRVATWRFPGTLPPARAEDVERLRAGLGLPVDARAIVYTGSFADYQGLPLLLAAVPEVLARVPDARFILVGAEDEDSCARIQARLPAEARERVHVLPRVARERVPAFLALAQVLVSPRADGGNLPLKIFDYMASGVPIVATDVASHRAVLDDARALLAAPRVDAFARAITRALDDPEASARRSAAARAYAARELTWERFVASVADLLPERAAAGVRDSRERAAPA